MIINFSKNGYNFFFFFGNVKNIFSGIKVIKGNRKSPK